MRKSIISVFGGCARAIKISIFLMLLVFTYLLGAYSYRIDAPPISLLKGAKPWLHLHSSKAAAETKIDAEARLKILSARNLEADRLLVLNKTRPHSLLGFLYSDINFVFEENAEQCAAIKLKFIEKFAQDHVISCNQIIYENTEHQTFSVLIKSDKRNKKSSLIIYNHGHGGLPSDSEDFAENFIRRALNGGVDVLLVSMPFTGIDRVNHDFSFRSWDGWSVASAELIKSNSNYLHSIFELYDTGRSHYIRYFVDNAVVAGFKLSKKYFSINYVGFSGGGTTGLYTCALLKDLLDSCVLIAGVMPANLRSTPKNFGDAEQISSSLHKKVNIFSVISEILKSRVKLTLQYNSNDSCCFPGESANKFQKQLIEKNLKNISFIVRDSDHHDYDPDQLFNELLITSR